MQAVIGTLAAILLLAGLMLLNSLRLRRRAKRQDVGPRVPKYFLRERDPDQRPGVAVYDEIARRMPPAQPCRGYDPELD